MANKIDLKARRVVDTAKGQELASSRELEYFECSTVGTKTLHIHVKLFLFQYKACLFPHVQKDQVDAEKPFVHLAQQFYSMYKAKSELLKGQT